MRIALISDIHGNLPALESVLADLDRVGSHDGVFHLGDLVGYGPWPNEVAGLLKERGITGVAGFVSDFTGSHRYILDYLTDEVLSRQPEAVQHFLVQTSILDRLSGSLCDAVLGRGAREQGSQGEFPPAPLPPCSSALAKDGRS